MAAGWTQAYISALNFGGDFVDGNVGAEIHTCIHTYIQPSYLVT